MEFRFPGDVVIDVLVGKNDSSEQIVGRIAAHPDIGKALDPVVHNNGFERYERWENMDDSVARDLAHSFLEGGSGGFMDCVGDRMDAVSDCGAYSYVENVLKGQDADLTSTIDAIIEVLDDAGIDSDDVADEFVEAVKDDLVELIEAADRSVPFDIIPSHVRVETIFALAPLGEEVDLDALQIAFDGVVCDVGTIRPNAGLKGLFERANVSFDAFCESVREMHGFRLDAGRSDGDLVAWLADSDWVGDREGATVRALSRADSWAEFSPAYDPDLPSVLDMEAMWTILQNATSGGIPVYVARLPLKDLVTRDWSVSTLMVPEKAYGERTGGFVGIYEPGDGSGYIERIDVPFQIPAGTESMKVSGKFGHAVDDVFGIVGSCYYARPIDDPSPRVVLEPASAPGL